MTARDMELWQETNVRHAYIQGLNLSALAGRLEELNAQLSEAFSPSDLRGHLEKALLQEINEGEERLSDHITSQEWRFLRHLMTPGVEIGEAELRSLHRLVSTGLRVRSPGDYRDRDIMVFWSPHKFAKHQDIAALMQSCLPVTDQAGASGVFHAGRIHHALVHIHPFSDANGRTTRLVMNLLLARQGWPAVQVPRAGWERVPYTRALRAADSSNFDDLDRYIALRVIEACEFLLQGKEAA